MKFSYSLVGIVVIVLSHLSIAHSAYNFSRIVNLTPGGSQVFFANEVTNIEVRIGADDVVNPCNKLAELFSNRASDIFIKETATVECQNNIATFEVKAVSAGPSTFSIRMEGKEFLVGYVQSINRRPTGGLIRSKGHTEVFFIKENDILPIHSAEEFNEYGFDWKSIVEVPQEEEFLYNQRETKPFEIWKDLVSEGSLISSFKYDGNPDIFIVNQYGFKRLFLNPVIYAFYGHLKNAFVRQVPGEVRDFFETSSYYKNCETLSDENVYTLKVTGEDTGMLHLEEMIYSDDDVFCINNKEFSWYPKG